MTIEYVGWVDANDVAQNLSTCCKKPRLRCQSPMLMYQCLNCNMYYIKKAEDTQFIMLKELPDDNIKSKST